jgi:hypothetical protein
VIKVFMDSHVYMTNTVGFDCLLVQWHVDMVYVHFFNGGCSIVL